MIRRSAFAAGALLGTFHLWLFGHQVWSGQLWDPATVARWAIAAALAAGLLDLRRRGLPVVFGRKAVAMWVLAAVLHGPALADDLDGFATPALPEAVVTVVQAASTLSALGLALYLSCVSGPWALAAAAGPSGPCAGTRALRLSPARITRFLPRPPPIA